MVIIDRYLLGIIILKLSSICISIKISSRYAAVFYFLNLTSIFLKIQMRHRVHTGYFVVRIG